MKDQSALYVGAVVHHRLETRSHRFRYNLFWILIDLDELSELPKRLRWFSHNRFNLFSLHDRDYGDGSATPLRLQVERQLTRAHLETTGCIIRLLSIPRILGYGFNPISIYFCQKPDGALLALLYEVHNTFGQRHGYLIPVEAGRKDIRQSCNKLFYVSPFMDMDLRYEFHVALPGERIMVSIRTCKGDRPVLNAHLAGRRQALTDAALLRIFLAIPLVTLKVTAAIHWEALRLWLKGLRLRHRPDPPQRLVTIVAAHSKTSD